MTRMLFLSSRSGGLCILAAQAVIARKMPNMEVVAAGVEESARHPAVARLLAEQGINEQSCRSQGLKRLSGTEFDIAVVLSDGIRDNISLLAGHPEVVEWHLPDLDTREETPGALASEYGRTADDIRRLVCDFFEHGYFSALLSAKQAENIILDGIHDGIIAHDMRRRIFFFNRAAETITGYDRKDVLNRDCNEVFPGKFCGGKCLFCESVPVKLETTRREVEIATKGGEKRTVDMIVQPLKDQAGILAGVIASFRDITRERSLAKRVKEVNSFAGIIGRDSKILEIFDIIRDLADVSAPVLIHGESGTGKELVSAAIHNEGVRGSRLFVPVNCGALPEALLESELFGHVKGAFTGAIRDKKGRFELADGGTIFLDEIGDISPAMQVKLLRVLQEGRFERVGSEKTIKVDVRIISATNKDLAREIAAGRFREDLFYRLSVVPVHLPPLRERRNDIPLLVDHFLGKMKSESGRKDLKIADETLDVMMSYDWPGNVREMQNWLQFAFIKCRGNAILPQHLPPSSGIGLARNNGGEPEQKVRHRRKLDAETVRRVLAATGGNRVETAASLGISRATLYRFMDENPSLAE